MNRDLWIVCERTNRWAAALRVALERDAAAGRPRCRLREVRHLAELTAELAQRPTSFVALEVHRTNLGDALAWLVASARQFPRARCAALLDRSLRSGERGTATPLRDLEAVLREAGSLEIAESSRELRAVLELGRRHAAADFSARRADNGDNLPFVDRVWASLPWQRA